ncbi:MAG: hypothetical protein U1F43_10365 [Myxococcota bacterium]
MVLTPARTLVACALAVALAGSACIGARAPERLAQPTAIAAYVWLEGADGQPSDVPSAVGARIEGALRERNLVPQTLGDAALAARVASLPTTAARLAARAAAAPDAPYVLLVEARAAFFSQLSGRYRWDVDARSTLAARDDLEHAQASTVGVAAVLQYDHEREPDALAFVGQQLVGDLTTLVDRFFAGRD